MNLLLDTNVLSEAQRPTPNARVLAWLDGVDEDRVFLSVASIAELRRGVALLEEGRRRAALTAWLANDLTARFDGRILPIDQGVAERWGDLMAESRKTGTALSVMDGFFAATALARALILVTRNVKDFAPFGVPLLNPWEESGAEGKPAQKSIDDVNVAKLSRPSNLGPRRREKRIAVMAMRTAHPLAICPFWSGVEARPRAASQSASAALTASGASCWTQCEASGRRRSVKSSTRFS